MAVKDDFVKTSDDTKIIGSSSDLSLSFGDSLYLNPNDTGGSPIVTIKLTSTENYKISKLFVGAIYAKTAYEMWNDLRDTYDKVDDDSYFAIRSNILTREPLPSVKATLAVVSGEESHRNVTSVGTTKPTATTFAAKTFDKKRYPAGYVKINFNANTRPVSSNNASTDVHSNSVNSNNATTSNPLVSLSNEQLARLVNLLNENGVSTANANMAVGNISLGWIVDSEANQHMTDLKANRNVGIGKQFNGLYLFDVDNACKIVSNNCIASCFVSKTLWHQRLGHSADQVLNALKPTLNLDSHSTFDHLCDTCNKVKQTREPFPLSERKSTKIGELVHLDVWGPYKVVSRDSFRYFLTFVDDFSRSIWVYMLKEKDDVYDSIISFVQMIFNSQRNFDIENTKRPNDKGRVSSNDDGTELSLDIQGNDDSGATSMDENNTHPEGTVPNKINFVNDFYENS
ncbi:ribonuclease H-like domain-containing protein [Tanacetum coccineum]